MSANPWATIAELDASHLEGEFQCGLDQVDDWFKSKALVAQVAGHVRTHVCLDEHDTVVGFFALQIAVIELPSGSLSKTQMQRVAGSKNHSGALAGVLLAQMGLSSEFQGAGAGRALLTTAISYAVRTHEMAATRAIFLDPATEELVTFYEKAGFSSVADSGGRMIMSMSVASKLAAAAVKTGSSQSRV